MHRDLSLQPRSQPPRTRSVQLPNRCVWNAPRCRLGATLLPGTELRDCYLKTHALDPLGILLISVNKAEAEIGGSGGPFEMRSSLLPKPSPSQHADLELVKWQGRVCWLGCHATMTAARESWVVGKKSTRAAFVTRKKDRRREGLCGLEKLEGRRLRHHGNKIEVLGTCLDFARIISPGGSTDSVCARAQ